MTETDLLGNGRGLTTVFIVVSGRVSLRRSYSRVNTG